MISITLKETIRKHILEIGGLMKEEPKQPQWEFAFVFKIFGKNGRTAIISKPKNKNCIEIVSRTKLDEKHRLSFNGLDNGQKLDFIKKLRSIMLDEFFEAIIEFRPDKCIFVIIDRIFLENETISTNDLYRSVKSVVFCSMKCVNFIQNSFDKNYDPGENGYDANDFKPYF